MFTLDFSESHTTVVCFKAGEGNQSDRHLFSHVKAQEIFTDVVILMMVTQLPQNETFDQDRGRALVSHGAGAQFLTITCGPRSSLWLCPRHCRCLAESLVLPTRCQWQASSITAPKTLPDIAKCPQGSKQPLVKTTALE